MYTCESLCTTCTRECMTIHSTLVYIEQTQNIALVLYLRCPLCVCVCLCVCASVDIYICVWPQAPVPPRMCGLREISRNFLITNMAPEIESVQSDSTDGGGIEATAHDLPDT